MGRVSILIMVLSLTLLLSACAQTPLRENMVPKAFSMYSRDHAKSLSIGKVTGLDPMFQKDKYRISETKFKQALGDALANSMLFQRVVFEDLSVNYILEADLIYNDKKRGFGGHPMLLVIRYYLYDQINGNLKWSIDIYSRGENGTLASRSEQAARANILRLIQELSKLGL